MFNSINPKQMQKVMKQMGISQKEIDASKIIIEKQDGDKIIIQNPSVTQVNMQGQTTFQISGDIQEESSAPEISKNDIKTIIEKTGKSEQEAREALEKTGDLAEAILDLSS